MFCQSSEPLHSKSLLLEGSSRHQSECRKWHLMVPHILSHIVSRNHKESCNLGLHCCVCIWGLKSRGLQSWSGGSELHETRSSYSSRSKKPVYICLEEQSHILLFYAPFWLLRSVNFDLCVREKNSLCRSLQLAQWTEGSISHLYRAPGSLDEVNLQHLDRSERVRGERKHLVTFWEQGFRCIWK